MGGLLQTLLYVRHPDVDVQRRGRNVIIISLGLIVMSLASIPLVLIQPEPVPQLIASLVGGLINLGAMVMARIGRVNLAATLLVTLMLLVLTITPLGSRQVGLVPMFLPIAVLIAGVTARPLLVGVAAVGAVAGIGVMGVALAEDPQKLAAAPEVLAVGAILAVTVGLISALGAQSAFRALMTAREAQERAEQSAAALDRSNRELEQRVEERTADLRTALAEAERREAEQARLLAENAAQRQTIRAMSIPVLPVSATTLVMPLVGDLDAERLAALQQDVLSAVERSGARQVLLDVTGVPMIDTQVAQGLLRVVQSMRLLGAEAVLIGVSPEVAQTIVGLGLDLSGLVVERDLRDALRRS